MDGVSTRNSVSRAEGGDALEILERCLISTASLGSKNLANKAEGCYGHVHSKEHHFLVITFLFLYFFYSL